MFAEIREKYASQYSYAIRRHKTTIKKDRPETKGTFWIGLRPNVDQHTTFASFQFLDRAQLEIVTLLKCIAHVIVEISAFPSLTTVSSLSFFFLFFFSSLLLLHPLLMIITYFIICIINNNNKIIIVVIIIILYLCNTIY